MNTKQNITIDLEKYGGTGSIVIGEPYFTRKVMTKNKAASLMKVSRDGGHEIVQDANPADIEVLSMLQYVRKAPFETDLKSFYAYCDKLDDKEVGSASAMYAAIQDAVLEYTKEGDEDSPLPN